MPHSGEHHYHLTEHLPHIGMRKIKSVLALLISFVFWQGLRIFFPVLETHPIFAYVYSIIEMRENPEKTKDAVAKELKHMIEISKCHSIRYPTIKKWFLAKYPEVAKFGTIEVPSEAQGEETETNSQNVIPMNTAEQTAELDLVG